jgi:hypothetical protein
MSYNPHAKRTDFELRLQMTLSSQSVNTTQNGAPLGTQGYGGESRQQGNVQSSGLANGYYGGASNAASKPAHEIPQYQRVPPDQVQYPNTSRPWGLDGVNTYHDAQQPYGFVPQRSYDPSGGGSGPWPAVTTRSASSTTWYTPADSREYGLLPGETSAYDAAFQQQPTVSRGWQDNGSSYNPAPPPSYEDATHPQPMGRPWDQQGATGYWDTEQKSG